MSQRHSRPVIGVTTQTLHSIDGIPAGLPESWVMNQRYFLAATIVGGVPWMVPLLDDDEDTLCEIYQHLDGVLLPGGVDMDPATFGEDRHPKLGAVDPARDRVELQLTRWAIEDRKPVLGLCRGIQVINVALGGTPVPGHRRPGSQRHQARLLPHRRVRARPPGPRSHRGQGSRLQHGRWSGTPSASTACTTRAIKTLAPDLVPSATAPDGLIEAVESASDHFLVGRAVAPGGVRAHRPAYPPSVS